MTWTSADLARRHLVRHRPGRRATGSAAHPLWRERSCRAHLHEERGPTDTPYGRVDLEGGDYGTNSQGAVLSGPVAPLDSGFRLAAERYYSNGYYHNLYLNRDDTNRQDEYTYRAKWAYTPSERLRIEFTAMQVNIDNGYDAYAIDNSRNTEADQPGVDSQHSTGCPCALIRG